MGRNNNNRGCGCNYQCLSQGKIKLGNIYVRHVAGEQKLFVPFCKTISPSRYRIPTNRKVLPAAFRSNSSGASERIRLGEPAALSSWRATAAITKPVTKSPSREKSDSREQKKDRQGKG